MPGLDPGIQKPLQGAMPARRELFRVRKSRREKLRRFLLLIVLFVLFFCYAQMS